MIDQVDLETHTGGCYCGNVRYSVTGVLRDIVVCHCSQCRKQSGHQYATTITSQDRVAIAGEDDITWFSASKEARRGFCACCGSHLFWWSNTNNDIAILAASLDKPTGLKLGVHIFSADKGDYYEISDNLEQYDAYPV